MIIGLKNILINKDNKDNNKALDKNHIMNNYLKSPDSTNYKNNKVKKENKNSDKELKTK